MCVNHPATRVLAALGLLVFLAPAAQAQTTVGVRGGVSVSSVDRDLSETLDDSNRTGFAGGVFVDVNGASPLGFQVGASTRRRGPTSTSTTPSRTCLSTTWRSRRS